MSKLYKTLVGTALAAGLAGCLQTQNRQPEQLYHWHKQNKPAEVSAVKTQNYTQRCTSDTCSQAMVSSSASVDAITSVSKPRSRMYHVAPIASQDTVAAPVTSTYHAAGLSPIEPLIVREPISIDKGYTRGGTEKKVCVIRTQEELNSCWKNLYEGTNVKRSLPAIDFSKEMVVGIFQGEQKTGHDISLIGALEGKRALELLIQEKEIPAGRPYHGTTTQSYHLVIMPKTTKDITNTYVKGK